MSRQPAPGSRQFAASAMAVAIALAVIPVKSALNAWAGDDVGFLPAVAAVVIVAWLGGFVPGVIATGVGMLVEATVFMEPRGVLVVALESDRLRLTLFGLTGMLASWLAWLRTRAEQEARASGAEATQARDRADLAARRLDALQALTTELSDAMTSEQITRIVLEQAVAALRADGGAVVLIEPGGDVLRTAASTGYEDDARGPHGTFSISAPVPAAEVARTGTPVFIEDPEDYLARYGAAFEELGIAVAAQSVAAVPFEVEGQRFGSLSFRWNGFHSLREDRRTFISALARLGAGSMERARLLEAERAALRRAEAAQGRLDLFAEAGRVLGMSLDYETTLRRLTRLALPVMGDVAVVDIPRAEGVQRLAASIDPALAAPVAVLESRPVDPAGNSPIAGVLRAGQAQVFPLVRGEVPSTSRDASHSAALAAVGARWALVAPIRVIDRTIGTLTLLRLADRPYDADDVAIVEELGSRAGRALENARLHGEVERLAERERHQVAELEAVIGAMGEGVLVADDEGRVRSWNAAAVRIIGAEVATVVEFLDRLLDTDDRQPSSLPSGPVEYRLGARPTAWVEVTAYPVNDPTGNASSSSVIVCRDVTAFRQGQGLREAFLGLLSHELRTPVTTIYAGAAMLSKPGSTLDQETAHEILADVASEANRLYRLVEDLLVLARFDEGIELGSEPALLQHLVPTVVEQERGRWPAVTFKVDVAPDLPAVSGDETSIVQVLRNLLSNAAKYGAGGSLVTAVVEPVADGVAVRVRDEGPGIDPAEAKSLFDPFYRSPSTAKMAGGAGIGLYVSRRLVDAMNGRIWAARRPEGGSEFSLELPRYVADIED